MHGLIALNRPLIFFVYGQAFFVLGLATAFQYRARSQFRLASSLWSLSAFGFLHGFAEWGHVFIPVQAGWMHSDLILVLTLVRHWLNIASFAFLFHFGLELLSETWRSTPWVRLIPWLIFGAWVGAVFAAYVEHRGIWAAETLNTYETIGRLLLALPGAVLTGTALYMQISQFRALGLGRLSIFLRSAAAGFIFYGFIAGLIGPPATFFPASILNSESFLAAVGIPVELFRTVTVSLITIAMMYVLGAFNLESRRRLEEAETQRAILNERLRISRDLHDGVMQSIYGVGLNLESTTYLVDENPHQVRRNIEQAMNRLNETIHDIRNYVLNLRTARPEPEEPYMAVLAEVDRFRQVSTIRPRLSVEDLKTIRLPAEHVAELHQIVREALTNVSRHARASQVVIKADREGPWLELSVEDNGSGFEVAEKDELPGRQGLANMRARAAMLGGSVTLRSQRGRGTKMVLKIPVEVDEHDA